jgi:predicted nucleic acid-binding protein
MKYFIIDASVIVAVFVEKDKAALDIFGKLVSDSAKKKVLLLAPSFALFEVANALRFSKEDKWPVFEIWELISQAPIHYYNYNDLNISFFPSIALLSRKLGTAFYDTYYHYLAMTLDGTFLTRDRAYFEKAKRLGNIQCF